jgi:hypothetical protein
MRPVSIAGGRWTVGLLWPALLLAGCRLDPRKGVLGEWRSGAGRMLFYPDGQVVTQQGDSTVSVARYEWRENDSLRIRSLAAEPADYGVRVTRDSLVMCAAGERCFRLARVAGADR